MPVSVGRTPSFRDAGGAIVPGSIAEVGAWPIGGIDQWVMIRGRSLDNPLLIVLHGGPGSSEASLFRAFNSGLEDAFTVVHWDQRGAGRTYSPDTPPETMTIDHFVADLDELVEQLLARFGRKQVVLLGHSWGSALGVFYASRFPAKVAAYVGVGQVADMAASEAASYDFAMAKARERGARRAIKQLVAIGPPPHTVRQVATQRRWLMAMGGAIGPNLTLGRMIWRGLTTPEGSLWDLVRLIRGSKFSLTHLWEELLSGSLRRDVRGLDVPVFFLLGRFDMQVAAPVSAAYFGELEAPHKELIWLENSGHMAPFEEPEVFNRTMIETVRPHAI